MSCLFFLLDLPTSPAPAEVLRFDAIIGVFRLLAGAYIAVATETHQVGSSAQGERELQRTANQQQATQSVALLHREPVKLLLDHDCSIIHTRLLS